MPGKSKAVELSVGYLRVLPSVKDFEGELKKQLGNTLGEYGKSQGRVVGKGVSDGIVEEVKKAEGEIAKAREAGAQATAGVEKAERALGAARKINASALSEVEKAERALSSARAIGQPDAIAAAEKRLADAKAAAAATNDRLIGAEGRLEKAKWAVHHATEAATVADRNHANALKASAAEVEKSGSLFDRAAVALGKYVDSAKGGEKSSAGLAQAMKAIESKNIAIGVDTKDGEGALSRLKQANNDTATGFGLIWSGASAGIAGLIPVAGAAAAAVAAIGLAAAGVGAGLGVAAMAIKPVLEAFKAQDAAEKSAAAESAKAAAARVQHAQAVKAAQEGVKSAERSVADAVRASADRQAAAARDVQDARKGVGDAIRKAAADQAAADRAVQDAQAGVAAAVRDAARQQEDAARSVAQARQAAADQVAAAAQRQQDAERQIVAAQKDSTLAQRDLIQARKDAAQQLADLANRTQDGALAERGAQLSLERAQEQLARVNSSRQTTTTTTTPVDPAKEIAARLAVERAAAAQAAQQQSLLVARQKEQAARDAVAVAEARARATKAGSVQAAAAQVAVERAAAAALQAEQRRQAIEAQRQAVDDAAKLAKMRQEALQPKTTSKTTGTTYSELDRKEAQLAVDEARQRLKEQQDANKQLAAQKADADKKGVEGSDRVQSALQRVADAQQKVRDAQAAQAAAATAYYRAQTEGAQRVALAEENAQRVAVDGQAKVAKAEQALADARAKARQTEIDGQDRIAAARQKLADAEAKQRQASITGAEAVARAQESLVSAQARLRAAMAKPVGGGGASDAQKKQADAMAKLTAEGRAFLPLLKQMQSGWEDLGKVAQSGFLPGAQAGLNALKPLMPSVTNLVRVLAQTMGDLAADMGKSLGGPEGKAFVDFLGRVLPAALRDAYAIAKNLGAGLGALFMAAAPGAMDMNDAMVKLSGSFAAWAKTVGKSDGFKSVMEYIRVNTPLVVATLGHLGVAAAKIVVALAPLGPVVLRLVNAFAQWVAGMDPKTLQTGVIAIGGISLALGRLGTLVTIVSAPFKALKAGVDTIKTLHSAIAVLKGAKELADVGAAAQRLVGVFNGFKTAGLLLRSFASVMSGTVLTAARVMATGITTAIRGIPIIGWITLIISGLVLLYQKNEWFRNHVNAVAKAIWGALQGVWGWITKTLWPGFTGFFSDLGKKASGWGKSISDAWASVRGYFSGALAWVRDTWTKSWGATTGWVAGAVEGGKRRVVDAWNATTSKFEAAKNWVRDTWTKAWSSVSGWVGSNVEAGKTRVVNAWDAATKKFETAKNWIRDTWLKGWNSAAGWVASNVESGKARVVSAWDTTTSKFESAKNWVRDTWLKSWANVSGWLSGAVSSGSSKIQDLFGRDDSHGLRGVFNAIKNWVFDQFKQSWDGLHTLLTDPVQAGKNWIENALGISDRLGLRGIFTTAVEAIGKIWDKLRETFKTPINAVIGFINDPLIKGLQDVGHLVGFTGLDGVRIKTLAEGGQVPGYAGGGIIPGPWRGPKADNVLGISDAGVPVARVNPKEFIHPVDAVDYYGVPAMELVRRKQAIILPAHAAGGLVELPAYGIGGKVQGLNAAFVKRLEAFNDAAGGRYSVLSGLRTRAEQEVLYAKFLAGTGNLAARPGTSRHESGVAADLTPSNARDVHGALAARYGLVFPVASESWHIEPAEGRKLGGPSTGGGGGGVWDWVKEKVSSAYSWITSVAGKAALATLDGIRGMVTGGVDRVIPQQPAVFGLMNSAAKKVGSSALDWVTSNLLPGVAAAEDGPAPSGGGGGGPVGSGVERWRSTVEKALSLTGQPASLVQTTLRRMMQESGGDPRAINNWDSNARRGTPSKGLMQVIDPTFATYRDRSLSADIYDPLANIVASMRYAIAQYGSLSAAYDRAGGYAEGGLVKPTLYDQGGILPPGLSVVSNETRRPEYILPADATARLLSGRGHTEKHITLHSHATPDEMLAALRREEREELTMLGLVGAL